MKKLAALAIAFALAVLAAPAHAESGYASPEFQLRGPVFMQCIDISPDPSIYDRTADVFECVGPVGTETVSGTLYQVIYVKRRSYHLWGEVTWHCAAVQGSWNRYTRPGRNNNLACSK